MAKESSDEPVAQECLTPNLSGLKLDAGSAACESNPSASLRASRTSPAREGGEWRRGVWSNLDP
ncbi:hypothetical protein ACYULU_11980 [Breznakiellaceae bacterium SP9]